MEILDDQGRLFGVVNVVDALVVLLVLAVFIAGLALVFGGSPPSENPDYVTLTVGPTSEDSAGALAAAQNVTMTSTPGVYPVTDVVLTPSPTEEAAIAVARLEVPPGADQLTIGDTLEFEVANYRASGAITAFAADPTIDTGTASVTLRTNVSAGIAAAIEPGDTHEIGQAAVATLRSVQTLGTTDRGRNRLLVGLELSSLQSDGASQYATSPVRLGATIPFRTSTYALEGEITALTANIQTEEQVVQLETTVTRSTAASVQAGDTVGAGDRVQAEITSVASYPSADQGQRRLTLGVRLQTRATADGQTFRGTPVRVGATIPIETGEYSLSGRIASLGSEPAGDPVDATLAVEWRDVRPAQADGLSEGMTAIHRGADARIVGVATEPATVILESEDGQIFAREHPVNEDVDLTLSVGARRTDEGVWFHGRPVQRGDTVVLDFGSITVRGQVTRLSTDG